MNVPKKTHDQMVAGIKALQPIIDQQKSRDVSEADTVTLVKDLLNDALGFDKYTELTGEHAIRGTYCDLVIKIDDKPVVIVEVKAIGISLDDKHVKQAVDYAANEGVEWVYLTNGVTWRLYAIVFGKPIDKFLVAEVDVLAIDTRKAANLEAMYLFSKAAIKRGDPKSTFDRMKATSRHMIAALLLHNDSVLNIVRREMKRVSGVTVTVEEIAETLRSEVIKREAITGKEADDAAKLVNEREGKALRAAPITNDTAASSHV